MYCCCGMLRNFLLQGASLFRPCGLFCFHSEVGATQVSFSIGGVIEIIEIIEVGDVALGTGVLPCILVADSNRDAQGLYGFYILDTGDGT